jgi:hypothetical protein
LQLKKRNKKKQKRHLKKGRKTMIEFNDRETSLIEKAMADLNRESIREKGHPFAVCQRINGVKHFKRYDALTVQEIAELRASGVVL